MDKFSEIIEYSIDIDHLPVAICIIIDLLSRHSMMLYTMQVIFA